MEYGKTDYVFAGGSGSGCHNPRIPDQVCFRPILVRLVTGSWGETVEQLMDGAVSDTTLRARRDEWVEAGVFDDLAAEALAAYDRITGVGSVRRFG